MRCAIWIAAIPTPPAPAWTSTRSPRCRWPSVTSAYCAVRHPVDQVGRGCHVRCERAGRDRDDPIADANMTDAGPGAHDDAGAFVTEHDGAFGIEVERDEDVAEVQAGHLDLDLDLAGTG